MRIVVGGLAAERSPQVHSGIVAGGHVMLLMECRYRNALLDMLSLEYIVQDTIVELKTGSLTLNVAEQAQSPAHVVIPLILMLGMGH